MQVIQIVTFLMSIVTTFYAISLFIRLRQSRAEFLHRVSVLVFGQILSDILFLFVCFLGTVHMLLGEGPLEWLSVSPIFLLFVRTLSMLILLSTTMYLLEYLKKMEDL